jgi:hypothetical protein
VTLPRPETAVLLLGGKLGAAGLAAQRKDASSSSDEPLLPAAIALFLVVVAGASLLRLSGQWPRRPGWH